MMKTRLPGVLILQAQVHADFRGFFTETYHLSRCREAGIDCTFVQDNESFCAVRGTIHGLYYQLHPFAQSKLIRVVTGTVYAVAVDVTAGSATFGQWIGVILSQYNHRQLFIPQGFAHGFCTLTDNTTVHYKVDRYPIKAYERGIRYDDAVLGIPWPTKSPILSDADKQQPLLHDAEPLQM